MAKKKVEVSESTDEVVTVPEISSGEVGLLEVGGGLNVTREEFNSAVNKINEIIRKLN